MREIYEAFNTNPILKVRGIFLDTSKAISFTEERFIVDSQMRTGINRNVVKLWENVLSNDHQCAILNIEEFLWNLFIKIQLDYVSFIFAKKKQHKNFEPS